MVVRPVAILSPPPCRRRLHQRVSCVHPGCHDGGTGLSVKRPMSRMYGMYGRTMHDGSVVTLGEQWELTLGLLSMSARRALPPFPRLTSTRLIQCRLMYPHSLTPHRSTGILGSVWGNTPRLLLFPGRPGGLHCLISSFPLHEPRLISRR